MEKKEMPNPVVVGWKKISPQARAAFFGALVFGDFAQGRGLFNKFSHHDDVSSLLFINKIMLT